MEISVSTIIIGCYVVRRRTPLPIIIIIIKIDKIPNVYFVRINDHKAD